uniref:site-specific DNA-methyltransferase (adenine-specific) n=1 Tax=Fervidicoccus fontis TaxID=683846 RepID=A0A7J3ZLG9_9CREN
MVEKAKILGQVFTPDWVADIIASWCIQSKNDLVLDPCAGTGVFIEAALKRLRELGASDPEANVVAIEFDRSLARLLEERYGKRGVRVVNSDFIDCVPESSAIRCSDGCRLPSFRAIIGNPPYVERQLMINFDKYEKKYPDISSLSDIYVYFIVHSSKFLEDGGRLGFIISDSWLTAGYGAFLKKFLLEKLKLKYVVYFDRRVFSERLVSTTIMLAEKTKRSSDRGREVVFIRVKNVDSSVVEKLKHIITLEGDPSKSSEDVVVSKVPVDRLSPNEPWLPYALGLKYYMMLKKHDLLVPLRQIANVNIGLFTLANDFYILDRSKKERFDIEDEFLRKIVVSPRELMSPVVEAKSLVNYVLYCNKTKEELEGTRVLSYIEWGERQVVAIRGKDITVVGYHNTPRIKKSGRRPWYNLVPEIDKRCIKPILLPRRVYDRFIVYWNKDGVVASDNFMVIEPNRREWVLPLLAILNSVIVEYFVRVTCHLYGGGVCDLTPDAAKEVPTADLSRLPLEDLEKLKQAFLNYVSSMNRRALDELVISILRLTNEDYNRIVEELEEIKKVQQER